MRQRRRRRDWKVRRTRPAVAGSADGRGPGPEVPQSLEVSCGQHCAWSTNDSQTAQYLFSCPDKMSSTKGHSSAPDIHLSQLWRLDILDQGASRFWVWWGSASSWVTGNISWHPHLEEGAGGSLWLPDKDTNLILGAPLLWLHHPPKPLPPNTITSRVRC